MLSVSFFNGTNAKVVPTRMTSGLARTSSRASVTMRSASLPPQRMLNSILRPSIQPNCCSIIGKIVGHGALTIFGHVDGELHASTVVIAEGAQMEGEVIAEELTVGGHVKGTIHANRVKLTSTAVVEGDIFHRTLAIEENARFEGASRRNENTIKTPSHPQPNRAQLQPAPTDGNRKGNSAPGGLSP
jgi:cytoskeletal protein CcmA (bactofilin family)